MGLRVSLLMAGVMIRFESRCHQYGFSYLFTLFFVALLGLNLALAAEVYSTSVQRDREQELLFIGRQFSSAIGQYYEANQRVGGTAAVSAVNAAVANNGAVSSNNRYPSSMQDLLLDSRSLSTKRHLRKIFIDPMTGKAKWGEMRFGGKIVGIYSLSDKTPIKQAFFEGEEQQFSGKAKYSEWVFTYPVNLVAKTSNDASKVTFSETSSNEIEAGVSNGEYGN